MKSALIIQWSVASFRVPFYEALGDALAERGVRLTVAYGQSEGLPADEPDPPPFRYSLKVRNTYLRIGPITAVWQPLLGRIGKPDLIIVQQGNKNLLSHILLLLRNTGFLRLALWGHGRNFQASNPGALRELYKRTSSRWVDHWFAYTHATRAVLLESGVPEEIITVVNNTIDTRSQQALYDSVAEEEIHELKRHFGIEEGGPVGIYCGRMYDIKKIPFLLRSLELLKRQLPPFHFFMIGHGPDAPLVRDFSVRNPSWFHSLGRLVGRDKALYFRLADVQLCPGAVGLAVVDSFAMLTPLVTTDIRIHGPEISYLQHGVNGLILEAEETLYAKGVADLLHDQNRLQNLRQGCGKARDTFTLEAMVERFAHGVTTALGQTKEAHAICSPKSLGAHMKQLVKRTIVRGILRRPLPLSLSPADLPWVSRVRAITDWNPSPDRVICNVNFDDLCPRYHGQNGLDYGGRPGTGVAQRLQTLLEAFPNIAVTLFTIPDCKVPVSGLPSGRKANYDISKPEFADWRAFYEQLRTKYKVELAVHGLHHWQTENRLFGRQSEFAFKPTHEVKEAIGEAVERFRSVGWEITGFRQPAWDVSGDLNLFGVLNSYGFRYVAASTADGGLNTGAVRVSLTHPCVVEGMLNLPQNVNLDWPVDKMLSEIDAIARSGGLVSIKGHFVNRGDTNCLSRENLETLLSALEAVQSRYGSRVQFMTLGQIGDMIFKGPGFAACQGAGARG